MTPERTKHKLAEPHIRKIKKERNRSSKIWTAQLIGYREWVRSVVEEERKKRMSREAWKEVEESTALRPCVCVCVR